MTELFDYIPESKSPRLLWMERYGVETGGPDEDDEFWAKAYCAGIERYGYGQTEDEAICNLAKRSGWKLWNEEGLNL